MATFKVRYREPGGEEKSHGIEAEGETEAKNKFLGLDWVAFTSIEIVGVEPAFIAARDYTQGGRLPDRPYDPFSPRVPPELAAKTARKPKEPDTTGREWPKPEPAAAQPPGYDWRKECNKLTDEIGKLTDKAQALTRKGKHDEADELRKMAKARADVRADITKRNKGK